MDNENAQSLIIDLDDNILFLENELETLSDIETLFYQLRQNMDNAVYRGDEKHYFREHYRMVRVLSRLLHGNLEDLEEGLKRFKEIHSRLLEQNATGQEKSHSAGNTIAFEKVAK